MPRIRSLAWRILPLLLLLILYWPSLTTWFFADGFGWLNLRHDVTSIGDVPSAIQERIPLGRFYPSCSARRVSASPKAQPNGFLLSARGMPLGPAGIARRRPRPRREQLPARRSVHGDVYRTQKSPRDRLLRYTN